MLVSPPVETRNAALVAARMVLAAVLLLCALMTLAYQARRAQGTELLEDAQQGRIRWVLVTDDTVVWRTGAVRLWQADLPLHVGDKTYRGLDLPSVLARYAPDQRSHVLPRSSLLPRWPHLLGVASTFGAFLLLVSGPPPWRANRWAWFWVFCIGETVALGAVVFLLLSGPTPGLQRPRPDRQRIGGARGFLYAFAGSLLLMLVWAVIRARVWPDSDGRAMFTEPPG